MSNTRKFTTPNKTKQVFGNILYNKPSILPGGWVGALGEGDHTKTTTLYKVDKDVLALSCAWWRLRNAGTVDVNYTQTGINGLSSNALYNNTLESDIEMAAKVRDYYGKKIVMWKLRGLQLTEFRKTLAGFIAGDGTTYTEEVKGVIYRLPEFYVHDTELDKITESANTVDFSVDQKTNLGKKSLVLRPVGSLWKITGTSKSKHYWFKDYLDRLHCIKVDKGNPLLPVWDSIYCLDKNLNIEGYLRYSNRGDFDHYILENWNLLDNLNLV